MQLIVGSGYTVTVRGLLPLRKSYMGNHKANNNNGVIVVISSDIWIMTYEWHTGMLRRKIEIQFTLLKSQSFSGTHLK